METRLYYSHTILASEITAKNKVSPYEYIKIMQEASMLSAQQLQVSFLDILEQNLSWVLVRKDITFVRYPALGEKIKVLTYPAGFEKVFAYRDYKVYDAEEQLIAYASSTWILMDVSTRRMTKIPKKILEIEVPKIELLERPIKRRDTITSSELNKSFNVNFFDLDWNNHANNNFLIKSLLEGSPINKLSNYTIQSMLLDFKLECHLNDRLTSAYQAKTETTTLHELLRESDGKVVLIGKCEWKVD